MDIYLVWHVSHKSADGLHRMDDEVRLDEDMGDDAKLLGCFSSQQTVDGRIRRARAEPGFRDEPDCFIIDRHTVDKDEWPEGFVTM